MICIHFYMFIYRRGCCRDVCICTLLVSDVTAGESKCLYLQICAYGCLCVYMYACLHAGPEAFEAMCV